MADKISLEELIVTGNRIREGISCVPPTRGVMRTSTPHKLADGQAYADWKGLVNIFMQNNYPESNAQEIKTLFLKFEKYSCRPHILDEILGILKALNTISVKSNPCINVDCKKIFIVHGHNEELIQKVARFLEKLEFEPIILKEQPNSGKTIIEKFEDLANTAFGVVLYTSCDRGSINYDKSELKPRARQNVIFEHGYLFAKLGRERVCALVEEGVEIPSDLSGVLYIPLDNNGSWKFQLAKEMKNAGLHIDLNKVL